MVTAISGGGQMAWIRIPVQCLDCGCSFVRFERHLASHGRTVDEYRARWAHLGEPVVVCAVSDSGVLVGGRVQLPPGATWSDGRDAATARQQQRDYRARRRLG
jgi:hypothetical protein